jgi:hypothetical protein
MLSPSGSAGNCKARQQPALSTGHGAYLGAGLPRGRLQLRDEVHQKVEELGKVGGVVALGQPQGHILLHETGGEPGGHACA